MNTYYSALFSNSKIEQTNVPLHQNNCPISHIFLLHFFFKYLLLLYAFFSQMHNTYNGFAMLLIAYLLPVLSWRVATALGSALECVRRYLQIQTVHHTNARITYWRDRREISSMTSPAISRLPASPV